MRLMLGVLLACSVAGAGLAAVDATATDAKAKVEEKAKCPFAKEAKAQATADAKATVEGKKECALDRKARGKMRGECAKVLAEAKALREAGAKMELQPAETGHVVVATSDSAELVARIRALSARQVEILTGLNPKDTKTCCPNCAQLAKALKAGNITVERVEIDGGVKVTYAAKTDEAKGILKNCCCANWGLKGPAACPKKAGSKT